MPKPNPLTQGLKQQNTPTLTETASIPASVETKAKIVPPSRSGRVLIGGHFAPEVQQQLRIIAAKERTTMQALLAEGINAVFARRNEPQIADVSVA